MDSLFERLTDVVTEAMSRALDGADRTLPPLQPPDEAAARQALTDLTDRARALSDAADPVAFVDAFEVWRQKLGDLARSAFADPTPADALLIRLLDERLPRTAAFLTLAGVIVRDPPGSDTIDRVRARQVLTDPGTAVNEELWDALLGDTGLPGTGRLPAVLLGLLILAPQTILALARGDLQVAGLPAPPTDAPGEWRTLRERSEGWISITVPIGDPARPAPVPGGILDLVADLEPDLSATLAIRSQRRSTATGPVTDFEMWLALADRADRWQLDLASDWFFRVEPGINVGFGHDGAWHGAFRQFLLGGQVPPGPGDPVVVSLGRELPDGAPDIALGPPYDTRLVAHDLGAYLKVREDEPVFEIGAFVQGFALVITNRWWRTFGITDTLLREGIRFDADLDIAYVQGMGLRLNLGTGLDVTFQIEKEFFKGSPISPKLHSIRLVVPIEATQNSFDIRAEIRFHASLRLGPAVVVVDGLGGWVGWWTEGGSKRVVGFLPPTGAGLEIAAGPFTGGGFLDFTGGPNERFGGVVYVRVGAFEITAFGLHELTGRPGEPNRRTSLILVLGIRFSPGIQLTFGIEISGFGGLIGINRRADTDALRERLTTGAAGNVLFAEDPIRNAPTLLGDLGALFPAEAGSHVFGLTIQLSWLNIAGAKFLRLDLGLIFAFPGPTIILLGSARATVPPIKAAPKLLDLRLDFVGFVDFPRQVVEFDATLISSRALFVFHLTGDVAFRLHWGSPPYLALTLGGFHPRFTPEPAVFPELTRLALTLDSPSPGLFLRVEAYFAVTSNTVQFGGRAELGYKAGPLNLIGFLSLDALIQFNPFYFELSVSAGVRLRWNSTTLAGVRLEGVISGPGPFVISGKACFEILWFDICAEASITLGPSAPPPPPAVSSVVQALRQELTAPSNLAAVGGEDRQAVVQLRPTAGPRPVVSPLGSLEWAQHRTPFELRVERFEGSRLPRPQSVVLTSDAGQGAVHDWVSPGSHRELDESEALNAPAFERCAVGLRLGFGMRASAPKSRTVTVTVIRLPRPPLPGVVALLFARLTLDGVLARTAATTVRDTVPRVAVRDPRMSVRGRDGALLDDDRTVSDAFARARGRGVPLNRRDLIDLGAF